MAEQRSLIKDDYVVEAFAADRADHPFHICSLPGRAGSAKNLNDVHGLNLLCELVSEDSITIPEQIARRLFERERLPEVAGRSIRRWDAWSH